MNCPTAGYLCADECYITTVYAGFCCPGFCGPNSVVNNPQYFTIEPTCEELTIVIEVGDCNGQGLQAAIINSCDFTGPEQVLDCNPGTGEGGMITLTATVEPGTTYWLMVDGSNGAECEFRINSVTCIGSNNMIGEVDSLIIADTSLCVGDIIESTLFHSVENYSTYFFVASWDNDTIFSFDADFDIAVPTEIDPGIYSVCRGLLNYCSQQFLFECDLVEISSFIEGYYVDTIVCLPPGDTVFTFDGHEFTHSGLYEIFYPNIDDELCDTINYLALTLQSDRFVFNEIQVNNNSEPDESGEMDSWIEFHNVSAFPQEIGGFYLSDDPQDLQKWQFPSGTIMPKKGYLIVWADNEPGEGEFHTNFTLSQSGGTLYFTNPCESFTKEVQYVAYKPGVTHARFPNATGDFIQRVPSFNDHNSNWIYNINGVLNEILAININDTIDEYGDHDPWLEFYNHSPYICNLYGAYLSDDASNPSKFLVTDKVIYQSGDYISFWLDNEPEEGDHHVNFTFSHNGPYLAIYNSNLELVDELFYGVQTPDTALARTPNGVGDWNTQRSTFNYSNDLISAIDEISYPDLIISPNPAKDQLYIINLPDHEVTMTITDIHGRFFEKDIHIADLPVSISDLMPGMYFITIVGKGKETRRFIKL